MAATPTTTPDLRSGASCSKLVTDLNWVMTSPHVLRPSDALAGLTLWSDEVSAAIIECSRAWIAALRFDPAPLVKFMSAVPRNNALGFYFAGLVEFWLRHCPALGSEFVATSLPIFVKAPGHTPKKVGEMIGAVKFLVRCIPEPPVLAAMNATLGVEKIPAPRGGGPPPTILLHLEASVKFFCSMVGVSLDPLDPLDAGSDRPCDTSIDQPQNALDTFRRFVGPFLHENLAWRLLEARRKVKLGRHRDVLSAMRRLAKVDSSEDVVEPGRRAQSVSAWAARGWLFYPLETAADVKAREAVSSRRLIGAWTDSIDALIDAGNSAAGTRCCWVILSKLHWLAPCTAVRNANDGSFVVRGVDELSIADLRVVSAEQLREKVTQLVAEMPTVPLLIAHVSECQPDIMREVSRTFLIGSTWRERAKPLVASVMWSRNRSNDTTDGVASHWSRQLDVPSAIDDDDDDDATQLYVVHASTERDESSTAQHGTGTPVLDRSGAVAAEPCKFGRRCNRRNCRFDHQKQVRQQEGCAPPAVLTASELAHAAASAPEQATGAMTPGLPDLLTGVTLHTMITGLRSPEFARKPELGHRLVRAWCLQTRAQAATTGADEAARAALVSLVLAVLTGESELCSRLTMRLVFVAKEHLPVRPPHAVENIDETTLRSIILSHACGAETSGENTSASSNLALAAALASCHFFSALPLTDAHSLFSRLLSAEESNVAEALAMRHCQDAAQRKPFVDACLENGFAKLARRLERKVGGPKESRGHSKRSRDVPPAEDTSLRRMCVPEADILLVDTDEDCDAAALLLLRDLARAPLIGIDMEWRPTKAKGSPMAPVSILQVATAERVYLLDLISLLSLEDTSAVERLMSIIFPRGTDGPEVVCCGWGLQSDLMRLRLSYPDFPPFSRSIWVLEMMDMNDARPSRKQQPSLASVVARELRVKLDKAMQISDWGARPLSPGQCEYAACDARVLLLLLWARDPHRKVSVGDAPMPVVTASMHAELTQLCRLMPLMPARASNDASVLVRAALRRTGLPDTTYDLDASSTLPSGGVIVKTIAIREQAPHTAAVWLCVLDIDRLVDLAKLASALDTTAPLELIPEEELIPTIGMPRGGVGPIGVTVAPSSSSDLPPDAPSAVGVVLDNPVLRHTALLLGAGAPQLVCMVSPEAVVRATGSRVAEISRWQ